MKKTILASGYFGSNPRLVSFLETVDSQVNQIGAGITLVSQNAFLDQPAIPAHCVPWQLRHSQIPPADVFRGYSFSTLAYLERRQAGGTPEAAKHRLCTFYQHMLRLIKERQPKLIIISVQFTARHIILKQLCDKQSIPTLFIGGGSLPGTISIDAIGQMAESSVYTNAFHYSHPAPSPSMLQTAKRYLDYARNNRDILDRKKQPIKDINQTRSSRAKHTVFLAGHNDYCSGTIPYTHPKATLHSPIFRTSLDAVRAIDAIASRNKWHILYKPHPNLVLHMGPLRRLQHRLINKMKLLTLRNTTIAANVNIYSLIDQADTCVTILSQSAYLFKISQKPTVMLGRNQLTPYGTTYNAEKRPEVEDSIRAAISLGDTKTMNENWVRHVAALLFYNSFSLTTELEGIVPMGARHAGKHIAGFL